MSHPRQRLPGATYGVALRCSERRFFLTPTRLHTAILAFLLAFYALKHGVRLHGYAVLSNHLHLVLTDPRGVLGEFMRDFASRAAKVFNFLHSRGENLFSSRGYTDWTLETPDDVLAHLAYVAANPVAAGLVPHPEQWPGLLSLPRDFLRPPKSVSQPARGFFQRGESRAYPSSISLRLHVPPGWSSPEAFVTAFERTLALALTEARAALRPNHVFPPRHVLRSQDPHAAPPGGTRPDFTIRPHLSNPTPERKQGLIAFRHSYAQALAAWRSGNREVTFPAGTFRMRRLHGARVARHE